MKSLACLQFEDAVNRKVFVNRKTMACKAVARTQVIPIARPILPGRYGAPSSPLLPFLVPSIFARNASGGPRGGKKDAPSARKKRERKEFQRVPVADSQKFALCDAIRFVKLSELLFTL